MTHESPTLQPRSPAVLPGARRARRRHGAVRCLAALFQPGLDRPLPGHSGRPAHPGVLRLFAAQTQADQFRQAGATAALARGHGLGGLAAGAGACRHSLQCDPGLAGGSGDAGQRGQRADREVPAGPVAATARRSPATDAPAGPVSRGTGGQHVLGQPDLRRRQAVACRCTSRSRWPLPCSPSRTSSPCSCSGAGNEARLAHGAHLGQPGRR